jgi:Na+:H+ antiporter, NhaA family
VLGKRIPPNVRVMLLALAVIDDVAAILVIALFYSAGIHVTGLLTVGVGVAAVFAFQRLDVRTAWAYILPGGLVWAGLLQTGVHPTLAGVILGLMTPSVFPTARERLVAAATHALDDLRERVGRDRPQPHDLAEPVRRLRNAQREILPPVVRVQLALHPWVAYGIMPLFALANAGVRIDGVEFAESSVATLTVAVACALLLGKPLGILGFTWLVTIARLGALAPGVTWRGVLLIGTLGGIGFTMSLFIANLAFSDPSLLAAAKLAVLIGSAAAGVGGLLLGRYVLISEPKREP